MRPYAAVIRDSFREALSSRVLWILLVVTTLSLAGLVPIGMRRQLTTGLRYEDLRDVRELVSVLRSAGQSPEPSLARHVWTRLPEDTQNQIQEYATSDDQRRLPDFQMKRRVTEQLNELLEQDDFFREDLWKGSALDQEARDLLSRGTEQLSELERQRVNRLALEAALPGQFRPGPPQSIIFSYLTWDVSEPLSIPEGQLKQAMGYVITVFVSIVVGFIGVFAAILVTASIMPNMFDAGSVALLLSKPISRPLLFLAKFLGGCWFVLINAAYLIGGVWLILGWRLSFWQHRLLLCIPIFLFLFVVYYSVSALAGLIWRNTVVAVMVTILFWFVCWTVGRAKDGVEMFFVHPNRLVKLVQAEDQLLAVNERGRVDRWDKQAGQWEEVFASDDSAPRPPFVMGPPFVGPVYDSQQQRLVAVEPVWPQAKLLVGNRADQWKRVETTGLPQGTRELLVEPDGAILLVARSGFFRPRKKAPEPAKPLEIFGWKVPSLGGHDLFLAAGPEPSTYVGRAVALNRDNGAIYACDGRVLTRFDPNEEGSYQTRQTVDVESDDSRVVVAAGGSTVLLAWGDGSIQVLDADRLEVQKTFTPEGRNQPRFAVAAPQGRWLAVLFHNRRLWLLDAQQQTAASMNVSGQGDISAALFTGPDRLLVAHRVNRVSQYQLPEGELQQTNVPPLSTMERVYRFAIQPVYTVFPKQGDMDNSINYLLTERETVDVGSSRDNLSSAQIKVDPWGPVWSSLVFVAVTLAIACLYLQRQDF